MARKTKADLEADIIERDQAIDSLRRELAEGREQIRAMRDDVVTLDLLREEHARRIESDRQNQVIGAKLVELLPRAEAADE